MSKAVREMLGKNVKRLRAEKGLTQPELAKKIGVSQKTISVLESGDPTYNPTLNVINDLAAALGVHPAKLLE